METQMFKETSNGSWVRFHSAKAAIYSWSVALGEKLLKGRVHID